MIQLSKLSSQKQSKMMEIKTRNGFIYNANDLVPSQVREQIKLAALQIERKSLYRTGTYQSRVLQRLLALERASDEFHHSKGLIQCM